MILNNMDTILKWETYIFWNGSNFAKRYDNNIGEKKIGAIHKFKFFNKQSA